MGLRKDYVPGDGLELEDEFNDVDDDRIGAVAVSVNDHPLVDKGKVVKRSVEQGKIALQGLISDLVSMLDSEHGVDRDGDLLIHRSGRDLNMLSTTFSLFIPVISPRGDVSRITVVFTLTDSAASDVYHSQLRRGEIARGIYNQVINEYRYFCIGTDGTDVT